MGVSTVPNNWLGVESSVPRSTIIPNLECLTPSEVEVWLPFSGQYQETLCPVNEQAATANNGNLHQLPFTGQYQSFCPINEQDASHGYRHLALPRLEESQATSDNQLNRAMQQKVLLAYIQYKKKSVTFRRNDARVSFVDHMHSKVCSKHACKCEQFFSLTSHYECCRDARCQICGTVKCSAVTDREATTRAIVNEYMENGSLDKLLFEKKREIEWDELHETEHVKRALLRDSGLARCGSLEPMQPLLKRLKVENPTSPSLPYNGIFYEIAPVTVQPCNKLPSLMHLPEYCVSPSIEMTEANIAEDDFPTPPEEVIASYKVGETDAIGSHNEEDINFINGTDTADNARDHSYNCEFNASSSFSEELAAGCEEGEIEARATSNHAELGTKSELAARESNCGIKQRGAFLIENFTRQQLKEHISSLNQCTEQDVDNENSCQLCGTIKLSLAPSPIYCSSCSVGIKRYATYYSIPEVNGLSYCLCSSCYNASRSKSITSSGIAVSKAELIKKKNDEEEEQEPWVQCDKCEGWQHQICALFNEDINKERGVDFVCPKCCLEEIENGERIPSQVRTVYGAKDLPRTMLSDHLEQRLFKCLQKNREEKARARGMRINEVPEAEGLVVREVLSVKKLVKVNKKLLDVLQDENYPDEFPYKSKVILLFQKIEGADVCLFIIYVQEYGAECGRPNQRCVYISYLDSVKYFRPETKTVAASGEALRTTVYHEILIGYLEYCKKRGFATCYIWACPPRKGQDYIFYCHPEVQKIPKQDKLRQWHTAMIQKGAKAGIVNRSTNFFDEYFTTGQFNSKVTAAHLPYFDGDYWSGAAEDLIKNIEKVSGGDSNKMRNKIISNRTLKAMGHTNPSGHVTKDILLMEQLSKTISPAKEDFIIAHLQFVCVCCHSAILDGYRWSCHSCSFQLCGRCHDAKQNTYMGSTHTLFSGEQHLLRKIMVDSPAETDDDVCIDNGLFESRYSFMSFCQKKNYQFDTLRRAKHSSMMILYYLHNPKAFLATTSTCCICDKDTQIDQCWRCEICSDYIVCAACYQRDGCSLHIHKLTPHSSSVEFSTKNTETLNKQLPIEQKVLKVLLHASRCGSRCSYPNCYRMKRLFYHSKGCTIRASGGCRDCKNIWLVLELHSRNCKEFDCAVPRCRDLKQHAKSLSIEESCGSLKRPSISGKAIPNL